MTTTTNTYRDEIARDIWQILDDGDAMTVQEAWDISDGGDDAYALAEALNDLFWCDDSVTGNGSGSYTFNAHEARGLVLDRLDEVREAFECFGDLEQLGRLLIDEEWEAIDVTARCCFLYGACEDVAAEMCETMAADRDDLVARGLLELDGVA